MLKKKKQLKCYEVTMDSEVYAVSLVTDPAIELNFIALSKNKPLQILLEKEDKHIIIGAVLTPDTPIYRRDGDDEFYIQFSKETVEKMAHEYLMSDRIYSFTEQHEDVADDIAVIESWVKMSDNDKSKDYGIDAPIGTWFMMAKVENEDIWQKIKNGELQGFSIEALANLSEIKNKIIKQNNMAKEKTNLEAIEITDNFWDRLRSIISDALGKSEKSEEVEKTVGEVVDAMEVEGGEKDEKPKVIEQEAEETTAEVVDEEVKDVIDEIEKVTETPAENAEALQAVIDGLQEEIAKKDEEIETLKKQNAKLSKQPSVKPLTKMASQKQNPREIIESLYNGTYFNK